MGDGGRLWGSVTGGQDNLSGRRKKEVLVSSLIPKMRIFSLLVHNLRSVTAALNDPNTEGRAGSIAC